MGVSSNTRLGGAPIHTWSRSGEMTETQTVVQVTLTGESPTRKRKSYTREEKLKVLFFYHGNNLYQTCKKFDLNSKTVLRWIKDEDKIKKTKKGRKRVQFQRSSQYPEMETRLHEEYKDLRKKGLKVSIANPFGCQSHVYAS